LTLAGIVTALDVKYSKKGNRFCIFKLEDQSSGVKCLAWSEAYGKYIEVLKNDELLIVDGRVESTEGQEITIILEECKKLADAIPLKARCLTIDVRKNDFNEVYLEELVTILNKNRGNCAVNFNFFLEPDVKIK
jgi:DNA polymerase-3 subunit alpha